MPSFVTVTSGNTAQAQDVNQLINALNGSAGNGVPISLTALNDSVNFALAVKNVDATNSRALQVLRSNNNVLIQADVNGVIASPDGGATTAQVMTVSHTQTLTNKTLTNPVVSGAGGTPAGTLGFSGTSLLVGDGTANRAVNVGGWVGFTPTLNQGGVVAATVNLARYAIVGKLAVVQIQLTATAGGGAGNITIAALPAAITALSANNTLPVGTFYYSGVAQRAGMAIQTTTTSLAFFVDNNAGYLGGAPAVTLANTHILAVNAAWEIA